MNERLVDVTTNVLLQTSECVFAGILVVEILKGILKKALPLLVNWVQFCIVVSPANRQSRQNFDYGQWIDPLEASEDYAEPTTAESITANQWRRIDCIRIVKKRVKQVIEFNCFIIRLRFIWCIFHSSAGKLSVAATCFHRSERIYTARSAS